MPPKTCRPIGAYGPGARWSGSERFHPACAPCSLERRPCPIGDVRVGDQACRGGLVGGRLVACHRHRTRANGLLVGPTALLPAPPSPEAERTDLRETPCAMPRRELDPGPQGSGRASSERASGLVRTAP